MALSDDASPAPEPQGTDPVCGHAFRFGFVGSPDSPAGPGTGPEEVQVPRCKHCDANTWETLAGRASGHLADVVLVVDDLVALVEDEPEAQLVGTALWTVLSIWRDLRRSFDPDLRQKPRTASTEALHEVIRQLEENLAIARDAAKSGEERAMLADSQREADYKVLQVLVAENQRHFNAWQAGAQLVATLEAELAELRADLEEEDEEEQGSVLSEVLPPEEYVSVRWHCGCFVGAPKWQGTEVYEPDECNASGAAAVLKEDFNAGCAVVVCPACHARLAQADEHLALVEEEAS